MVCSMLYKYLRVTLWMQLLLSTYIHVSLGSSQFTKEELINMSTPRPSVSALEMMYFSCVRTWTSAVKSNLARKMSLGHVSENKKKHSRLDSSWEDY